MNWYKSSSAYGLSYNPSNSDLQQNFFDFYSLVSMFKKHPLGHQDEIEETINEFTKISADFWKNELLRDVFECLGDEIEHIQDQILNDKYMHADDEHILMAIRTVTDIDEDSASNFFYHPYTGKNNPIQYVNFCKLLFEKLNWSESYGGKVWADICNLWLQLYSANSTSSKILIIDRIMDTEHNTDALLTKLNNYQGWIKFALDFKYQVKSVKSYLNYVTPSVAKLINIYTKSRQETHYNDHNDLVEMVKAKPFDISRIKKPSVELQLIAVKESPGVIFYIDNPPEIVQLEVANQAPWIVADMPYATERVKIRAGERIQEMKKKFIKTPTHPNGLDMPE